MTSSGRAVPPADLDPPARWLNSLVAGMASQQISVPDKGFFGAGRNEPLFRADTKPDRVLHSPFASARVRPKPVGIVVNFAEGWRPSVSPARTRWGPPRRREPARTVEFLPGPFGSGPLPAPIRHSQPGSGWPSGAEERG